MILRNPYVINNYFKPNDIVYACAFAETTAKNTTKPHFTQKQEPIRGILTRGYNKTDDDWKTKNQHNTIQYFVPFKKNSTEPAWSKAVQIYNRYYATTLKECEELYNLLIAEAASHHETIARNLRSYQLHDANYEDTFYTALQNIHKTRFPNLRFGQLLFDFNHWLHQQKQMDTFYITNENLLKLLNEYADFIQSPIPTN